MTVCTWLAGWGHGGHSGAACHGGTTWAGLPAFVLDFLKRLLGKESGKAQEPLPSGLPGSEPGKRDKPGGPRLSVPVSRTPLGRPGSCTGHDEGAHPEAFRGGSGLWTPSSGLGGPLSWSTMQPGFQDLGGCRDNSRCPSWTLPLSLRKYRYHCVPISQRHRLRR